MKLNPLLEEKPDHGHYTTCLSRKEEIDRYCNRAFAYTVFASVIMAVFTLGATSIPLISLLPGLVGDRWDVAHIFVQLIELIGLCVLAAAACSKKKILLVYLMLFYLALFVASLVTGTFPGVVIGFLLGLGGFILTIRSQFIYRDYEQLKKTEGWPHFARWMAEDRERPKYSYDEFRRRAAEKAAAEAKYTAPRPRTEPRKPAASSDPEAARMADEVMRAAEAEARERRSFDPYEARRLAEEEARRASGDYAAEAAGVTRGMPAPYYSTSDDDMPALDGASALLGVPEPAMISGEYTDGFEPM